MSSRRSNRRGCFIDTTTGGTLRFPHPRRSPVRHCSPKETLMRILRLPFCVLLLLSSVTLIAQQAPLSQRVVQYDIDAKYDARNHSLDAVETLTWRNFTGKPQDKF